MESRLHTVTDDEQQMQMRWVDPEVFLEPSLTKSQIVLDRFAVHQCSYSSTCIDIV